MPQAPNLDFFDLETLRLAFFHALRRVNDAFGLLDHYYVIGQPTPWPRRSKSMALLAKHGYIAPVDIDGIEMDMALTDAGNALYQEFLKREASGELKSDIRRLQEKRLAELRQAISDFDLMDARDVDDIRYIFPEETGKVG